MSSASNDQGANRNPIRALQIPELSCIIFDLIGKQNAARLGCTSQAMFRSFMPLAWEHVSSATQIFSLITGVRIVYPEVEEDEMKAISDGISVHESPRVLGPPFEEEAVTITLPDTVDDDDLARLGVYAPFVKTLDVFGNEDLPFILLNWRALLEHADKHPLLPSLSSIRFANLENKSDLHYVWMSMFISPALQNFEVVILEEHQPPNTPLCVASALLKKLFNRCSGLRTLALFPSVDADPHEDEISVLEGVFGNKLDARPCCVNALREMSISWAMIDAFVELDCLQFPALENLSIYTSPFKDVDCALLSQISFPNVRHLSLFDLVYDKALHEIWHALGSTAGELTHVELHFHERYWARRMKFQRGCVLLKLVSFLIAHGPRIVDLSFYVAPPDDGLQARPISGPDTISLLEALPLERLYILGTCISGTLLPSFRLGQVFSQLKSLELPHQRTATSSLYLFADAMPQLEYLAVFLWTHGAEPPERGAADRSIALRHLESNFEVYEMPCFAEAQYTSALGFARFLYSIWPNVQLVAKEHPPWIQTKDHTIDGPPDICRAIELINAQLSGLARLNKMSDSGYVSFDSVGTMNKDSWGECFIEARTYEFSGGR